MINLASKLGELNPEVARDIIAQFPKVVTLLNNIIDHLIQKSSELSLEYVF